MSAGSWNPAPRIVRDAASTIKGLALRGSSESENRDMKDPQRISPAALLGALPSLYFNEALELAGRGEMEEAREKLHAVVSLDTAPAVAYVVLGKVYAQQADYERAIRYWEHALQEDDGNVAAKRGIERAREMQAERSRKVRLRGHLMVVVPLLLLVVGITSVLIYQRVSGNLTSPQPLPLDEVRGTISDQAAIIGGDLEVTASGESIQLHGSVATPAARDVAIALSCAAAPGVLVDGLGIIVRHPEPVATSFVSLLREVGDDDLVGINATQRGDTLIISGEVPTDKERGRLSRLANVFVDINHVDNTGILTLGFRTRVIRPGETLWGLADRFYGDGTLWPRIAELNPEIPAPYRRIKIGTVVRIPLQ